MIDIIFGVYLIVMMALMGRQSRKTKRSLDYFELQLDVAIEGMKEDQP